MAKSKNTAVEAEEVKTVTSEEVQTVNTEAVVTEEVVTEEVQATVEAAEVVVTEESNTEIVVQEAAFVVSSKQVSIKALENHSCMISQKEYSIVKGKEYKVPEDVAYILSGANKAVIK